ncbi:MAG: cob(I)yrinic acid a,c-diamide adenosyltransferase [Thermodesulfobacteriota bacterium]
MTGYIQVYTGNGKGKTTAALGLAMRAAGAGLTVMIGQFLKHGEYSEINALKAFNDLITVEQYGCGKFVRGAPSKEEKESALRGLERLRENIKKNTYDMIIVEEGNVAVTCGLITENDLLELMDMKQENMELVVTGRGATQNIIERADLVTEMVEIKHYFKSGVAARKGVEK